MTDSSSPELAESVVILVALESRDFYQAFRCVPFDALPVSKPAPFSSEFGSKSNSKSVLPLVETEDFIPIPPSDEEEGSEGDPDDYPVPQGLEAASEAQINKLSSTWLDIAPRSEGQPSLVRKGRKRNAVEMDEDMSESEYRQKLNMETRKTPWAKDVDWDGCVNVSQMYVPLPLTRSFLFDLLVRNSHHF